MSTLPSVSGRVSGRFITAYTSHRFSSKLHLDELPRDQAIVAYCRGPYCMFADEAVALLHEQGYTAYRLTEGLPDWRAQGYPVAVENTQGAGA